jgi:hypothetical protein
VIGQPPRQLDRNIAVVGRVVEGIQFLSALPRAPGNGVYKDPADRTPILSVRLASDLPADQQPHWNFSRPSTDFARYADLRGHRKDDFIKVAANGADICSIPVPIRRHRRPDRRVRSQRIARSRPRAQQNSYSAPALVILHTCPHGWRRRQGAVRRPVRIQPRHDPMPGIWR